MRDYRKIRTRISRLPRWLCTIVVACIILWLTLLPRPLGDIEPPLFPGADKIVHALMFGALAAAILFDYLRQHQWYKVSAAVVGISALISIAAGIVIEYAQGYMQMGRSNDPIDMIADAIGVILIVALWPLIQSRIAVRR